MSLKSLKTVCVLPNGCVFFDCVSYVKIYKKHRFFKKNLYPNNLIKKKSSIDSTFFYQKYYNQSIKKQYEFFKINC